MRDASGRLCEMRIARSWSFVGSVSLLLACDVAEAGEVSEAEAIEAAVGASSGSTRSPAVRPSERRYATRSRSSSRSSAW